MKSAINYFLMFWVPLNLILFLGSGNFLTKKENSVFFPFEIEVKHYIYTKEVKVFNITNYDYTEFLIYAIIPVFIFGILFRYDRSLLNFCKNNLFNPSKFTQRFLSIYLNWLILHLIFLWAGNARWSKGSFWPFQSGNLLSGVAAHYDFEEFIIYTLLLPFVIYLSLYLWRRK